MSDAHSPRIETTRLMLRLPLQEDFEGYAELFADEEAARYVGGHLPRATAWRKFLQMPGAWAVQGFAMFSVVDKASGEWLGQAGPWRPEPHNGNEVGWIFRRSAWGKGYATEAATAAIDWAFAALGWDDMMHNIMPDNLPSIALAERLGSSYRGMVRLSPPYADGEIGVWGQSREQWMSRRSSEVGQ